MSEKWIVKWSYRFNQHTGCSEPISEEKARRWVAFGNRHHAEIHHWAEKVKEGDDEKAN